MKITAKRVLLFGATLALTLLPLQAQAHSCSTAAAAGKWNYTYVGTIFTAAGPLPAASVGHFSEDAAGNITGKQTRSVAGNSGEEDISGTLSVNRDCTGTATIAVYVSGQLQRTAVLAISFDSNMNHARGIFSSLVLPDNTNVPVVITTDNSRVSPRQ